ncbi:MAG: DUF6498-containing protein [bacterium]
MPVGLHRMPSVDNISSDRSARYLLASNAFAALAALMAGWDLGQLMWIYWAQSVTIGCYNFRRMRLLRNFTTAGMTMNDSPVPETEQGKRSTANFFAAHYGFFHLCYLFFLISEQRLSFLDMAGVVICSMAFFYNHRFSFRYNVENDMRRKLNLGTLMMFPYARILPMHFTIIAGASGNWHSTGSLLLFMGLKTSADIIMHYVEHALKGKPLDGNGFRQNLLNGTGMR